VQQSRAHQPNFGAELNKVKRKELDDDALDSEAGAAPPILAYHYGEVFNYDAAFNYAKDLSAGSGTRSHTLPTTITHHEMLLFKIIIHSIAAAALYP
jgi:hypothetical protein